MVVLPSVPVTPDHAETPARVVVERGGQLRETASSRVGDDDDGIEDPGRVRDALGNHGYRAVARSHQQ